MFITDVFQTAIGNVLDTLSRIWPLLLLSILVSVVLKLYVNQEKVARFLSRNTRNSVLTSTAMAVGTPFCSCGTTAVVLGMMASTIPWAPIVAFLVASPLTSPQQMIYSAGLFGWPFAIAFMVASILLGLIGGFVAALAEKHGWLDGQARLNSRKGTVSLRSQSVDVSQSRVTAKQFASTAFDLTWKLFLMFMGFSFIGYFLNGLVPQGWIETIFGTGNFFSVPLAALLGLPFYVNTEASMPMVRAFLDSGMSQGAALAFLITGAGTSIGALTGALTIARWRVISIVLAVLVVGAIAFGGMYDLIATLYF